MNSLKNTLKNMITRNETYVKYRLPFTSDRYLIRWHPKSGTDIHKHDGKNCDFMMIWGTLQEVRFDSDNIYSLQDIQQINMFEKVHINDDIGYHQIFNLDNMTKISIHKYYD